MWPALSSRSRGSLQPADSDFVFHGFEVGVAGDELGVVQFGHRGGEEDIHRLHRFHGWKVAAEE